MQYNTPTQNCKNTSDSLARHFKVAVFYLLQFHNLFQQSSLFTFHKVIPRILFTTYTFIPGILSTIYTFTQRPFLTLHKCSAVIQSTIHTFILEMFFFHSPSIPQIFICTCHECAYPGIFIFHKWLICLWGFFLSAIHAFIPKIFCFKNSPRLSRILSFCCPIIHFRSLYFLMLIHIS